MGGKIKTKQGTRLGVGKEDSDRRANFSTVLLLELARMALNPTATNPSTLAQDSTPSKLMGMHLIPKKSEAPAVEEKKCSWRRGLQADST